MGVGWRSKSPPFPPLFPRDRHHTSPNMPKQKTSVSRKRTAIEEVVKEGVQKGVLIPLHPKRFTYALMGMCNWMHRWYRPGGEWTPDTVAEEFIRILESGYLTHRVGNNHAPCVQEVQALRREVEELKSMVVTLVRANQSDRTAASRKRPRPSSSAR